MTFALYRRETALPCGTSASAKSRLRVIQVTPRYHPYAGGVETHVWEVSRRLARRGVAITVLTTDPSGRLPSREIIDGVEILRVRAWPGDRDYYFAPGIYRVIRTGLWDVVHVQSYHTAVPPLAMAAALRSGMPYVVTFHGGGHSSRLRNALRALQWALLRPQLARAARLIAVAKFEMRFFSRQLRIPLERFIYIPNGADLPNPPAATSQSGVRRRGTLIASVGRLERYKGHQRVIAALPHLLTQQPDTHLWIAGTGPYEPELRRMARRLGVADRVEIRAIPWEDRGQMALELMKSNLVVLLSEYETHPIAVLEAIGLGIPTLVADTSGLSELAQQGLARAIPLRSSAEQVAAAMLGQLCNPLAHEELHLPSWDDASDQLLALYQTVDDLSGKCSCLAGNPT
jgi:glycogen synthase